MCSFRRSAIAETFGRQHLFSGEGVKSQRPRGGQISTTVSTRPPKLFSARIDGGNDSRVSLWNWAEQIPGQGLADLVILSVFSRDYPPGTTGDNQDAALTERIVNLRAALASNGVGLFLAVYPGGQAVSPLEALRTRDFNIDSDDMRFEAFPIGEDHYATSIRKSGVPFYSAYNDLMAYERGAHTKPLFGIVDSHFTQFGSSYYGELIAGSLAAQKPWKAAPSPSR